ncbi:MAG: NAD(P)-dependent oxidoreductase [Planctomycetota bacterium]
MAEYIVGAALTSLRRISKVDRAIHQKSDEEVWWGTDNILDPSACHPAELHGKNAGLIGLGRIGRYLAGLLQPFNVDVRAYDPYVEDSVFEESHCQRMELSELLASSDIIVPLLPEVDETRNLLDGSALARIQEGALILNASRGSVIDQEALIRNLRERRLWAALDVYEDEPLPDDSPLRKLDNVILTSHMAGPTPESARRHAAIAVEQLYEYMKS